MSERESPGARSDAPPSLRVVHSRPRKRTLGDKLQELGRRAPHVLTAIETLVDYALKALHAEG